MQTSVFQNGIIIIDNKSNVEIYDRDPYGYRCSTEVGEP
jgi:hypothetical protein